MQMSRRVLLLINPSSRSGSDAELDAALADAREQGWVIDVVESQSAEHACSVIKERHEKIDVLMVGGGDGSLNSILPCVVEFNLPLAVLPLGTANDLARSLGLDGSIEQAFQVLQTNRRRQIDVGYVNDKPFFNVAHVGLGVKVTNELTGDAKKRWGILSYLGAFYSVLSRRRTLTLDMTVDGKQKSVRSLQVSIGNGRFYGGGNVVDEDCQIDDGYLSVYSLRPQSVLALLLLAPLIRMGFQKWSPKVEAFKTRSLVIQAKKSLEVRADGEPLAYTPAEFVVKPGQLTALVPAEEN